MEKILIGLMLVSSIAFGKMVRCEKLAQAKYLVTTENTLETNEGLWSEKMRAIEQAHEFISVLEYHTDEEMFRGIAYIFSEGEYRLGEDRKITRVFTATISKTNYK